MFLLFVVVNRKHNDAQSSVEILDGTRLPYFLQIKKVTNDNTTMIYDIKEIESKKKYQNEELKYQGKKDQLKYLNDKHSDFYGIAIYNQINNISPLTNVITLRKYPFNTYPPLPNDNYKPQPIDIMSVRQIFDKKGKTLRLYWNIPQLTYGLIKYKVMQRSIMSDEKKQNDDVHSQIMNTLPVLYSFAAIPCKINIVTISIFNDDISIESEPSDTIYLDLPAVLTVKYVNFSNKPEINIRIDDIKNISFDEFKIILIKQCQKFQFIEENDRDKLRIRVAEKSNQMIDVLNDNFHKLIAPVITPSHCGNNMKLPKIHLLFIT